jgi:hypothetical protein
MRMSPWKIAVLRGAFALLFLGLGIAGRLPKARYPRFLTLATRARRAADRGRYERAGSLARDLLELAEQYQHDWNYGNALHNAHLVLGRVALAAQDLADARAELLLAGQTPGSPQLNSFGPDMSLARDLLRAGQRDVVLQYFDLCRRFWEMGGDQLDAWAADVAQGREPQFGASLAY